MDAEDRWAINDVVARYFLAIDRRDWARLATCFTRDVEGIYEGVRVAGGIEEMMAFFEGRSLHRFPLEIVNLRSSVHTMGNHVATVTGANAVSETYAMAYLLDEPDDGPRLRARALRYLDELVRTDDGWRISRREHVLEWMRREELLSAPVLGQGWSRNGDSRRR